MCLEECQKACRLAPIHVWICRGNVQAISWGLRLEKSYYFLHVFFISVGRKIFVMDKPHHADHLFPLFSYVLSHVPLILWNQKPQLHLTQSCLINLQNRTHALHAA